MARLSATQASRTIRAVTKAAVCRLRDRNWSYPGGAADLKEELKRLAAAHDLAYDSEIIESAMHAAEHELGKQHRRHSEPRASRLRPWSATEAGPVESVKAERSNPTTTAADPTARDPIPLGASSPAADAEAERNRRALQESVRDLARKKAMPRGAT